MWLFNYLNPFRILSDSPESQISALETNLAQVTSYEEWKEIALALDKLKGLCHIFYSYLKGNEEWKKEPSGALYDHQLIADRLQVIKNAIAKQDYPQLMRVLRSGLLRNLGGLGNASLYGR